MMQWILKKPSHFFFSGQIVKIQHRINQIFYLQNKTQALFTHQQGKSLSLNVFPHPEYKSIL